jgi:hypothetical protein
LKGGSKGLQGEHGIKVGLNLICANILILYLFVIFPKPSTAPNLPCIFLFFYFRIFQKNNLFYFVELFIHGETFSPIIGTFHPYKVVIFIQVVNFHPSPKL